MFIVLRVVIDYPGNARVDVGAAEIFGADDFPGGRFHQRRPTEKYGALFAHDDRLVAHRRHVSTARGTGTHHHRNLWNTTGRHVRLVIKNAAEVFAVRKHVLLARQVRPARIDQVNTGQIVLRRDVLRTQMLLYRDRVIGATFHGRIVGDDHAFLVADAADTGDQSAGGNIIFTIHFVAGELADFKKGGPGIDQAVDAIARQQLVATQVFGACTFTAALGNGGNLCIQIVYQRPHRLAILHKFGVATADF